MTRLKSEWLEGAREDIKKHDAKLRKMTGMGLSALAFRAAGKPVIPNGAMNRHRVAAIRVSAGEGAIDCFAESVAAVAAYLGAEAFIPDAGDVAGLYEALSRGADILFLADDDRFIALHAQKGIVAENDAATAAGFVTALSAAAGGLTGRETLLLGFGRLGQKALTDLLAAGASVQVYDRDREKTAGLAEGLPGIEKERVTVLPGLPPKLSGPVFDATDEGKYLGAKDLSDDMILAAPGIPLSLDDDAFRLYGDRVLHEPLYTGVAVMLAMAL